MQFRQIHKKEADNPCQTYWEPFLLMAKNLQLDVVARWRESNLSDSVSNYEVKVPTWGALHR